MAVSPWPGTDPDQTGQVSVNKSKKPMHPFVYLPGKTDPGSYPPNATARLTQERNEQRRSNVSAAGGVIPVLFGQDDQVAGKLIYLNVINGVLHVIWLLGEGEFTEIGTPKLNDKTYTDYPGVVVEKYVGTSAQTVCGLAAYDATFTDALMDIAYIYCRIPAGSGIEDIPRLSVSCRGLKVYDPRTAGDRYTTNPALEAAELLSNTRFGRRLHTSLVDWDAVSAAAAYCDEVVGGLPRYECNMLFDVRTTLREAFNAVLLHFLGYRTRSADGTYAIHANQPRAVAAHFEEFPDNSPVSKIKDIKLYGLRGPDRINLVRWVWTDPVTGDPVEEEIEDPGLGANDETQEASYDLTGCRTLSQSKRIATYQLNQRLADLLVELQVVDHQGVEPMDVFTVTHSIGLATKKFYCTAVNPAPDGWMTIYGREYDEACYSDAVEVEPTYTDTNLPSPLDPPPDISGLEAEEILIQLKDATWIDNIQLSWSAPANYPFVERYEMWRDKGAGYIHIGDAPGNITFFSDRAVQEMVEHTYIVQAVSRWGKKAAGVSIGVTPQGKFAPPVWKEGAALSGEEAGDVVLLRYYMADGSRPAVDIDIVGFQIRRGRTTDTWETATIIDPAIDAMFYQDKTCPSGTWRYFLKALDSVGNETDTALTVDVTVTLNPYLGYQQDRQFNMASFAGSNVGIGADGSIVPVSASYDTLGEKFPGPALTAGVGGDTYLHTPAPATADATCDYIDLGQILTGNWSLTYTSVKHGAGTASLTAKLLLSINTTDWAEHDAASVFQASARYVKVKFQFTSAAADTSYVVVGPTCYVTISCKPKEEHGEATVDATGVEAIVFAETFVSIEKISLEPLASAARIAQPDNLTTSGFDLKLFDATGTAVAGTVKWQVEGF